MAENNSNDELRKSLIANKTFLNKLGVLSDNISDATKTTAKMGSDLAKKQISSAHEELKTEASFILGDSYEKVAKMGAGMMSVMVAGKGKFSSMMDKKNLDRQNSNTDKKLDKNLGDDTKSMKDSIDTFTKAATTNSTLYVHDTHTEPILINIESLMVDLLRNAKKVSSTKENISLERNNIPRIVPFNKTLDHYKNNITSLSSISSDVSENTKFGMLNSVYNDGILENTSVMMKLQQAEADSNRSFEGWLAGMWVGIKNLWSTPDPVAVKQFNRLHSIKSMMQKYFGFTVKDAEEQNERRLKTWAFFTKGIFWDAPMGVLAGGAKITNFLYRKAMGEDKKRGEEQKKETKTFSQNIEDTRNIIKDMFNWLVSSATARKNMFKKTDEKNKKEAKKLTLKGKLKKKGSKLGETLKPYIIMFSMFAGVFAAKVIKPLVWIGKGLSFVANLFSFKNPIILKIGEGITKFTGFLKNTGGWLAKILSKVPMFATFGKAFMSGFSKLFYPIQIVLSIFDFVSAFRSKEGNFFEKFKAGLVGVVMGIMELPLIALGWIGDKILGLFGVEVEGGLGSKLVSGFKWVTEKIFGFIMWPFNIISNLISGFKNTEGSFFDKVKGGLVNMVSGIMKLPLTALGWMWDKILGLFGVEIKGGIGKKFISGFKWVIGNLFDLIISPFRLLMKGTKMLITGALKFIPGGKWLLKKLNMNTPSDDEKSGKRTYSISDDVKNYLKNKSVKNPLNDIHVMEKAAAINDKMKDVLASKEIKDALGSLDSNLAKSLNGLNTTVGKAATGANKQITVLQQKIQKASELAAENIPAEIENFGVILQNTSWGFN